MIGHRVFPGEGAHEFTGPPALALNMSFNTVCPSTEAEARTGNFLLTSIHAVLRIPPVFYIRYAIGKQNRKFPILL